MTRCVAARHERQGHILRSTYAGVAPNPQTLKMSEADEGPAQPDPHSKPRENRRAKRYDVYLLSEGRGQGTSDRLGQKLQEIEKKLNEAGLRTCSIGDTPTTIATGEDSGMPQDDVKDSKYVLAFITRNFMQRVAGETTGEGEEPAEDAWRSKLCEFTFLYAAINKLTTPIIPVVVEPSFLNQKLWMGPVRHHLAAKRAFNLTASGKGLQEQTSALIQGILDMESERSPVASQRTSRRTSSVASPTPPGSKSLSRQGSVEKPQSIPLEELMAAWELSCKA